MTEPDFIAALRTIATHPAARGLNDDAAVLGDLVLTHDMIAEGVHFLPSDPPADVAWKLVAVNLSDLAAKGATPLGALVGYTLAGDDAWDRAFIAGLNDALVAFKLPLLGGDTVSLPSGGTRMFGLTAIGQAPATGAPSRSGAQPGQALFVTGSIGDAALGLRVARGELDGPPGLLDAYRRPVPLLAAGQALAPHVSAMMDVSDGLLLDANRLAQASDVAIDIDIDTIPLSEAFTAHMGRDRTARLTACTGGDDYQLLFSASNVPGDIGVPITRIGSISSGSGLKLHDANGFFALPGKLGYLHG